MPGFIGIDDAKGYLVVEEDQDFLVRDLIDSASAFVESQTGYVAGERVETFTFDRFERQFELPLRPVSDGTVTIEYLDATGATQTFDRVRIITKNGTVRILPAVGASWPRAASVAGAVQVKATVGFGATVEDGAPGAPDNLKHAVRLCVGSWFHDREVGPIPDAVLLLLKDERVRVL